MYLPVVIGERLMRYNFKQRSKETLRQVGKFKELYLIMLVPFLIFLYFNFVPYLNIRWAFTNFGETRPDNVSFIGLANFTRLLGAAQFKRSFINTLIISFYKLLFGFPVPIIFAILLNEMLVLRVKKTIQTIIYFPHFLSWVVVGSIWFMLLAPQYSVNADVAKFFGVEPTYWFADSSKIRGLLVASGIWQGAGYSAIVYLAALSSIDPKLYEAAVIDGAGKMRQIWHITLPGIRPTIIILLILSMGRILNIFTQVIVMVSPVVYEKADVIMTYAYRTGIEQMKIGYSMSVSLFKAVISFVLVMITNRFSKAFGEEGVY